MQGLSVGGGEATYLLSYCFQAWPPAAPFGQILANESKEEKVQAVHHCAAVPPAGGKEVAACSPFWLHFTMSQIWWRDSGLPPLTPQEAAGGTPVLQGAMRLEHQRKLHASGVCEGGEGLS